MKKLLMICLLISLLGFVQSDTAIDSEGRIISINQQVIDDLARKYKTLLKNTGWVEGWRLQKKFTSKREDILPYQSRFANLYHEIPARITFDSPYDKLTVGKFRTKNEALKIKHKIGKNFAGAHPVSIIIDPDLLIN